MGFSDFHLSVQRRKVKLVGEKYGDTEPSGWTRVTTIFPENDNLRQIVATI